MLLLCTGLANVDVLANYGEAASGAVRPQVTHLHFTALLFGAHSGVDCCSHTRIRTTEERRKLGKKIPQILAIPCAALVFQKVRGAEQVPLLAYRPRSVSTEVKFWTWSVAVELDDEFDDEPTSTRYLIERQRKLGESPRPIDRLTAMVLGGALGDRLNGLSDRQIGNCFSISAGQSVTSTVLS